MMCIWSFYCHAAYCRGRARSNSCLTPTAECLAQTQLLYLKPVQTGYPEDSDARLVVRCVSAGQPSVVRHCAASRGFCCSGSAILAMH